jgi:hypothetical protein
MPSDFGAHTPAALKLPHHLNLPPDRHEDAAAARVPLHNQG